ncbi:MAG: hypothetical protein Ct9H90mP18_08010 [Gammaproteobacteria bacterium]|nr:MAG: hypothetical protein Ct9H90mP18_08010 [Gammaproteobacteria bacterium]
MMKITNLINVEDLARIVWRVIKDKIKNEIINVSEEPNNINRILFKNI